MKLRTTANFSVLALILRLHPATLIVIFNLSSKVIPTRIKFLLAFGLEFKLPVWTLNFYDYFLSFEKLIRSISSLPLPSRFKFQDVKQRIRTIAYNCYHGFQPSRVFSPVFSKSDVKLLKQFPSDESIVVTKPDKGRGVVILDKSDYRTKVNDILSDRSKFSVVKQPLHKVLLQVEDKINRVLNKLKKSAAITDKVYNGLHVSGSTPGILYGLPKIHKLLVPLRPIFAACGTPTYKLAKCLVPLLSSLTINQFTVKNSYEFANDLQSVKINRNGVLASFYIESLFTNIPVKETVDICISSLFTSTDTVAGITKRLFRTLLELAVLNSYFLFDNVLY